MSMHGRALTDADGALRPLPHSLPDHPAWEGEAVVAGAVAAAVDLVDC
tara:strand:- start:1777 stop:1920 length:144 start_codon:yes stop_codon:yes gene_type:complete